MYFGYVINVFEHEGYINLTIISKLFQWFGNCVTRYIPIYGRTVIHSQANISTLVIFHTKQSITYQLYATIRETTKGSAI